MSSVTRSSLSHEYPAGIGQSVKRKMGCLSYERAGRWEHHAITAIELDLSAVDARQRLRWASEVATLIVSMAERVVETADRRAGDTVLDPGTGKAALAAARCGCGVTDVGSIPALLERGRARARAEGLTVTSAEGDVETRSYPECSFNAAMSAVRRR